MDLVSLSFVTPSHFSGALSTLRASLGLCNTSHVQPAVFNHSRDAHTVAVKRNILDHKRRHLCEKYELRRKLHKSLALDPELPAEIREKHRYKLSKLPRNSAFTRVKNRCILSGHSRAVYQKFRMSRIVFRTLANRGELNGVKKASW